MPKLNELLILKITKMRKRIENKIYDTETAKLVCIYYYNGMAGYNHTYNTIYYIKRTGELFSTYNGDIYIDEFPNVTLDSLLQKTESSFVYYEDDFSYISCTTIPFVEVYNDELFKQLVSNSK